MMPANAHTSKKFTRMCFEKSEVTSAEKKIKRNIKIKKKKKLKLKEICI